MDQLETGDVHLGIVEETMAAQNIESTILDESQQLLNN